MENDEVINLITRNKKTNKSKTFMNKNYTGVIGKALLLLLPEEFLDFI